MVLQNKYKARASKRYNAARGAASDGRGRGRGLGRGGAGGRPNRAAFPSLPGQEDGDDGGGGGDDNEEEELDEETRAQQTKYAPRKLMSNSWRYKGGAGDKNEDSEDGAETESEPEVDLSAVLERVAKLDSSRTSQAVSNEAAARRALDADAADVDTSLLPLIERQRQRQRELERGRGVGLDDHGGRSNSDTKDRSGGATGGLLDSRPHPSARYELSEEQRRELEREGRRLQIEKERQEKHERRTRLLQQQAKSLSLDIGSYAQRGAHAKGAAASSGTRKERDDKHTDAFLSQDPDDEAERVASRPSAGKSLSPHKGEVDDFFSELGTRHDAEDCTEHALAGSGTIHAPAKAAQQHREQQTRLPPPFARANPNPQDPEDFLDSVL